MTTQLRPSGLARLLLVVLVVSLLLPVGVRPARATVDAGRDRIAGATRVETAARLARAAFPSGTETALLARADVFADAVSASGLAGALQAPVLLTDVDRLPDATVEALRDLGVRTVHVLGGDAAVHPAVLQALEDEGFAWIRYQGRDRYETAALVAQQAVALAPLGQLGGRTTVLLASGTRFPDALGASPVAFHGPFPILLTDGPRLPEFTTAMLDELGPEQVVVLGGPLAVPGTVADELRGQGYAVRRVAGSDRTATAAAVADLAVDELGFTAGEVLLARGDAFPDALAAGPLGGVRQGPVLLTPGPDRLGSAAATWIAQHCEAIDLVTAIGGPAALAEVVLDAAEREARECGYASVTPYLVLGATRTGAHGLVPVARQAAPTTSPLAAALEALLAGPTAAEASASPPVTTAIPAGTGLNGVTVTDGIATVDLTSRYDDGGGTTSMFMRLAQVVYTATRFPAVQGVRFELDGEPVDTFSSEGIELDGPQTRADYTEQLPNLFVDVPAYGGTIGNPAHVAGVASVFEAQFDYELRADDGTVVARGPVMASDQVLGTFDVLVPYAVDQRQSGTLRVFDRSPRDGSIENLRVYPVELTPASTG